MKISVIIPVYNAEKYVEQAVKSALSQEEVEEIILIEDGSFDNSLEICRGLEVKYKKVKLFQHPSGENKGAGGTRNIGLKNAKFEFIAFLDADDFYLKNRFKKTKQVFKTNCKADGVYEAIGACFEDLQSEDIWKIKNGKKLTTLAKEVDPDDLFKFLILGRQGHFSLDGLTIKKEILDSSLGLFDKNLRISQDTHFCLKLSLVKNLFPGEIGRPVTKRRVHRENRITQVDSKKMIAIRDDLWESLAEWSLGRKISFSNKALIFFMNYYYNKLKKIVREREDREINQSKYYPYTLLSFSLRNPLSGLVVFYNIIKYLLKGLF